MSLGGGPREHWRAAGQGRKSLGCMGAEHPVGNGGSAALGTSRRWWCCLTEGMRKPDYLSTSSHLRWLGQGPRGRLEHLCGAILQYLLQGAMRASEGKHSSRDGSRECGGEATGCDGVSLDRGKGFGVCSGEMFHQHHSGGYVENRLGHMSGSRDRR